MYGLFEDEDDVFMGSPKSKMMDVVFNANNDIVRHELEKFIDTTAAMELMLSKYIGDDIHGEVNKFVASNSAEVEQKAKSLYIEIMGEILSQSE